MRVAVIDSYYPAFLRTLSVDLQSTYQSELQRTLELSFGTFDAYSRNLHAIGVECIDIIANHSRLQAMWAAERGMDNASLEEIALAQIEAFASDVVFCQDLSYFRTETLRQLGDRYLLAGQCSCAMPDRNKVKQFAVLFTSFPHYVEAFEKLGVRGVYLPLAFDPIVLERTEPQERIHDCVFVGGIGPQWEAGTGVLHRVAEAIPSFKWWGYGAGSLHTNTALAKAFQGPAWGLDMYRILRQSKIVINRHGEASHGYSNNLRMFEATGCGALLLTEASPNIGDFFTNADTYRSADEAVERVQYWLSREPFRAAVASDLQGKTLHAHTYAHRMPVVVEALEQALQRWTAHIPA